MEEVKLMSPEETVTVNAIITVYDRVEELSSPELLLKFLKEVTGRDYSTLIGK